MLGANVAAMGGDGRLRFNIADTLEDGYELRSNTTFIALSTNEAAYITGLDSPLRYRAFLRYLGVAIPQGATIAAASITMKKRAGGSGTAWGWLHGVAADNAAQWATPGNRPYDASRTTAKAAAVNAPTAVHDVTAIVQEIVNRPGWASGNAMAFTFDPTDADGYIEYYSFEAAGANKSTSTLVVTLG